MLKRILVPLDGSPLADRILTQVRRLLLRKDAEVVLLGVVDPGAPDPILDLPERLRRARDHLEGVRDGLVDQGAVVTVEAVAGDPARTIVERARRMDAELVAMSTHGRSGLSRLLRGSVAEAVVRASASPVLLANPRALDAAAEPRLGRILVPLDGSEVSLGILPAVEALARLHEAEVLLLRVEWQVPIDIYPGTVALRPPGEVAALLEPHRRRLEERGLRARSLVTYGPEAAEILDAAERERVDLIAMSTHGRSGVSRWLLGSVAEAVLRHCARPLLLVRRVAPAPEPAAPASPAAPRTVGARELLGTPVTDRASDLELGRVEDVIVDLATSRVGYVVVTHGGVLSNARLYPIPWSRLQWGRGHLVLAHHRRPEDHAKDAPSLPADAWRREGHAAVAALAPAIQQYYGA